MVSVCVFIITVNVVLHSPVQIILYFLKNRREKLVLCIKNNRPQCFVAPNSSLVEVLTTLSKLRLHTKLPSSQI